METSQYLQVRRCYAAVLKCNLRDAASKFQYVCGHLILACSHLV